MPARASNPRSPHAGGREEPPTRGKPRDGHHKHFQENFAALGGSQKAEAARGTGREEAASGRRRHHHQAPAPLAPEPHGRQGGSEGTWGHHGGGQERSLMSGRARGGCRGLHQPPPAPAECVGCQRRLRLEMWHGISLQREGWGHVPTGKHIPGTELPWAAPGSGPFTAHQLPHLLPQAGGRESRSPFPTQWPQNC